MSKNLYIYIYTYRNVEYIKLHIANTAILYGFACVPCTVFRNAIALKKLRSFVCLLHTPPLNNIYLYIYIYIYIYISIYIYKALLVIPVKLCCCCVALSINNTRITIVVDVQAIPGAHPHLLSFPWKVSTVTMQQGYLD